MESLTGFTTILMNAFSSATGNRNFLECIVGTAVAIVVLRLEVTRRAGPQNTTGNTGESYGAKTVKLLQQHAPEVISLVACLTVAATLRIRGSTDHGLPESLVQEWPILLTADTLLALQALMRSLVLISTVLRVGGGPTLLSQEAAALACGAALVRVALAARSDVYLLDGPLGGKLPVACEFLSLLLLAILCRGIRRSALMVSALTLAVAAWIASRNHLSLASDTVTDALFIFAHLAELLAAFAYLSRALVLDTGLGGHAKVNVALHYAHMIMPIQQCFAAYYFVQAFEYVPELVSVGRPFNILIIGGVAQLGAYASAAILHLAEYVDAPTDEEAHHDTSSARAANMPAQVNIPQFAPGLTF